MLFAWNILDSEVLFIFISLHKLQNRIVTVENMVIFYFLLINENTSVNISPLFFLSLLSSLSRIFLMPIIGLGLKLFFFLFFFLIYLLN